MKKTESMTLTKLTFEAIKEKGQFTELTQDIAIKYENQKIKYAGSERQTATFPHYWLKTLLVIFILSIYIHPTSAQKSAVLDALSKHGIDANILNADNIKQPGNYGFDLKQTSITAGKQTVTTARFDPSASAEEQWTVISVDGKSPSRTDINSFRKNHNKQPVTPQTDDSSYKIEKETSEYLVLSYKQIPASSDKDGAFMKDCRLFMTINLKTKQLQQVQAINEKPLKIKILTAEKFDLIVKYRWDTQANRYFTENEDLNILAKFIGQTTTIQTISAYSNYTKK